MARQYLFICLFLVKYHKQTQVSDFGLGSGALGSGQTGWAPHLEMCYVFILFYDNVNVS